MPLTSVISGNPIRALDLNQLVNLLTGTLTDQAVTVKNQLLLAPGVAGASPAPSGWGSVPVKIAETTLSSITGSIAFNSIPQTFRHLMLVSSSVQSDVGFALLQMQYNGDTGTNYAQVAITANGGAVTLTIQSINPATTVRIGTAADHATAAWSSSQITWVFDYTQSLRRINALSLECADYGSLFGELFFADWKPATLVPVTSILVFASGANLGVGSRVGLYGVP